MQLTKGRFPSLLAWGLLVGGVALLITFPEINTGNALFIGAIPAALLFVLAGLVFGMSHPEGADWAGGLLLGWVPAVAGVIRYLGSDDVPMATLAVLATAPALLAVAGSGVGALIGRIRGRGES